MDLSFDQPYGCRLASATVLITLEDVPPHLIDHMRGSDPSQLQITEYYGPRYLTGEAASVVVTKTLHLSPELKILGAGACGIGLDTEKALTYDSRWTFTGQLHATNGAAYRTVKWELCENELGGRASHSNVIHTGFAFQHDERPFFMRVEIQGRLQSTLHRIRNSMRNLRFPPPNKCDQGSSETLVCPPSRARPLDELARGLPSALERENYMRIPVQVPMSLPVTFESQPLSANAGDEPGSALLSVPVDSRSGRVSVSSSSTTLVDELKDESTTCTVDSNAILLGNAVNSFHRSHSDGQSQSQGKSQSLGETQVQRQSHDEEQQKLSPVLPHVDPIIPRDPAWDALGLLSQYPGLLVVVRLLAGILDLFSGSKDVDTGTSQ